MVTRLLSASVLLLFFSACGASVVDSTTEGDRTAPAVERTETPTPGAPADAPSQPAMAQAAGAGGYVQTDTQPSPRAGAPQGKGEGAAGAPSQGTTGQAGAAQAGAGQAGAGQAGAGQAGAPAKPPVAAYDGQGFVVHEWGTHTIVVGSDGGMLAGLHHEEEDLPGFVYDRMKAAASQGPPSVVSVKMETPVTYFYSTEPRKVRVSVDFPAGVLTQWYPRVSQFYPPVLDTFTVQGEVLRDPVLDPSFVFTTPECKQQYGVMAQGLLDWGEIDVLMPGQAGPLPEAPLDLYTWSHAREVAANPVRVGDQDERFLFYRGLGNFALPLEVTAGVDGSVGLHNREASLPMGKAFVIRVEPEAKGPGRGAFVPIDGGVPGGATVSQMAPDPAALLAFDEYADELGGAVQGALTHAGLYDDEASSMVRTWRRQWFGTPGLRVLYLLPQQLTDVQVPLHVEPSPDKTVRVMMIRVELLTPDLEQADAAAVALFGTESEPAARQHFVALGRFAEPRLRRAIALTKAPEAASAFLAEVAGVVSQGMMGE